MGSPQEAPQPRSVRWLQTSLVIAVMAFAGITARAGTGGPDAQFVKQSVPPIAANGVPIAVVVEFSNTGDIPWDRDVALVCEQGDSCPWTPKSVPLQSKSSTNALVIQPGQTFSRVFTVITPAKAGIYAFSWHLTIDGVPFGQASPPIQIRVVQ